MQSFGLPAKLLENCFSLCPFSLGHLLKLNLAFNTLVECEF